MVWRLNLFDLPSHPIPEIAEAARQLNAAVSAHISKKADHLRLALTASVYSVDQRGREVGASYAMALADLTKP
jgi:hypothetical protein